MILDESHRFVPCGEGINAHLISFRSPFAEYRADEKVCPRCEAGRKRKGAASQRSRTGQSLTLPPWLRRESIIESPRTDNVFTDRLWGNPKYSAARDAAAIQNEYKIATAVAFSEKLFSNKVMDKKVGHERDPKDPKDPKGRELLSEQLLRTSHEPGNSEIRRGARIPDTAEWDQ